MIRPVLLALLLAACTHDAPFPGTKDDRIVVVIDDKVKTLDPRFVSDAASVRVSRLVFASLASVDNSKLVPEPQMAARWDQDPRDPALWLVTLREGLRWHDGVPVTADDVVYTFKSVMDPALGSPLRDAYAAAFESVTAVDPLTISFRLKVPLATFLTDLVLGIVPKHVVEPHGGRFDGTRFVGCGPYRLLAMDGKRVDLEAAPVPKLAKVPHHALKVGEEAPKAAQAPKIRYLSFVTAVDEGTRILSLLSGTADLLQGTISPVLARELESNRQLAVDWAPSIAFSYVALNLRREGLDDVRVRQALAYATPRETIVASHLAGHATLATGMFSPLHWSYHRDVATYPFDVPRARTLLAAAGFGPSRPLKITMKVSTHRLRRAIARMIAEGWKQAGVEIDVRSYEFSTFFADIRSGNFDAYLLDQPEPMEPDLYRWMLHSLATPQKDRGAAEATSVYARYDRRFLPPGALSDAVSGDPTCATWATSVTRSAIQNAVFTAFGDPTPYSTANRMGYANPQVDCRLELGRVTLDRKMRKHLYDEVQAMLAQDLPVIPLWHAHTPVVRRKRLQGYTALPNQRWGGLVHASLSADQP